MSKHTFRNTDERIISLNDERYLRIKTYHASADWSLSQLSDEELVEAFMRQPLYDHLLVGPTGYDEKDEGVQKSGQHGPFALERLSSDLYRRLSEKEFRRRLQDHYDDPFYIEEGPVSESAVAEISLFLSELPLNACRIFGLEISFEEAETYFGDMPLHSDFDEYVLVERDQLHFFIIAWD